MRTAACPASLARCSDAFEVDPGSYCVLPGPIAYAACLVIGDSDHYASQANQYNSCRAMIPDEAMCCAMQGGALRANYDTCTMMILDEANYPICPL